MVDTDKSSKRKVMWHVLVLHDYKTKMAAVDKKTYGSSLEKCLNPYGFTTHARVNIITLLCYIR